MSALRTVAVVPALDEAAGIERTLADLPRAVDAVVVVDGGSRDGTANMARMLGAEVVEERRRGYGLACRRGLDVAVKLGAEVAAVVDAGGTTPRDALARALRLVLGGEADLALGTRTGLRPLQRTGNRVVLTAARLLAGGHGTDLGPPRVLRLEHLAALGLTEPGYGWPIELLCRAHQLGLTVAEVPTVLAPRRGRSKVSGNPLAVPAAGLSMLRTVLRCRGRRRR